VEAQHPRSRPRGRQINDDRRTVSIQKNSEDMVKTPFLSQHIIPIDTWEVFFFGTSS